MAMCRADARTAVVYWERQVVSTLRDADGKPTHLIVVKEDVSDRKVRRADYAQTRHLHEKALASSSNGIMITRSDADDHSIVYVNPAFERITGYSADEVIGLEGRFLVRDDLAQPDLEHIRSALREQARRPGHAAQLPQGRLAVLERTAHSAGARPHRWRHHPLCQRHQRQSANACATSMHWSTRPTTTA